MGLSLFLGWVEGSFLVKCRRTTGYNVTSHLLIRIEYILHRESWDFLAAAQIQAGGHATNYYFVYVGLELRY